jgi:hypothetical protein
MNQKLVLIRQIFVAVILIYSATTFVSCEKYAYDPPKINYADTVYFQATIVPIFTANCTSCHGASFAPDLRADKAYESLINGGFINKTTPSSSLLYTTVTSSPHNTRCSVEDQNNILVWITQGALDN